MRLKEMTVATLAGWLLITPTMASENWKADVEKWKSEAKKWEAIAKRYEDRYGWINDKYGWCSLNRNLNTFSGYDGPNCFKPWEPPCAMSRNCSDWEIESYKFELENWIACRKEYIREAQDDAGCALLQIREGIDEAVEGE